MTKQLLLLALAGLSALSPVRGETVAPPDPQLIMPARFSFTKTFKYPPAPLSPNASEAEKKRAAFFATYVQVVEKMEFSKDGETKKETVHFTNGQQKEVWKSGEFTFFTDAANPNATMVLSASMVNDDSVIKNLLVPPFDELSWVDRTTYEGEEEHEGMKCYVYKSGNMKAWFDQTTRLPIFFQSPKVQTAYTYGTGEVLTLPEKYVKKLEETRRAWAGVR